MEITEKLLIELQNRLKVGSRRGVHLNAIPARSRYKFDITRLSHIDESLPKNFINALLKDQPLKFKISWKDNVPDLNSLFEEDQTQLVKITKSFENLINQTNAIESEKGINTFGFGYPILARRDQSDNKLTVAPILIWSLRIKRTKEFNTWEILRSEDDPIYINEVLINHLQNDSKIEIDQLSSDYLNDGLIDQEELLDICTDLIKSINSTTADDLRETFKKKMETVKPIPDKKHYEKLPLTSNNSFIDFGGLFSIFEVQKQNIIQDYGNLLQLEGMTINLEDMEEHTFQPISSVETDPSQQGILHALENTRNILIQGPPGTGKSQSLTAILVNALENHKKTIVVCEKRTALEVLYNQLYAKGLNYQCVLLKDIVKDRRVAVDSVRDRVDNSSYRRYRYTHSKETLDNIIDKAETLIYSINSRHKKLDKKLIGNKNWTQVVGELLVQLKTNEEDYSLDIPKDNLTYESSELNELLECIRNGHNFYTKYSPYKSLTFINPNKLEGDNPFKIEQQVKEDLSQYKKDHQVIINKIKEYKTEFEQIRNSQLELQIERVTKIHDQIAEIFSSYNNDIDFFDEEKTNTALHKFLSLFSKEKKNKRLDQDKINQLFEEYILVSQQSKDLENIKQKNSLIEKKIQLASTEESLKNTKEVFAKKIENEFKSFDLFNELNTELETDLLSNTRAKLNQLKSKLTEENWTITDFSNLSHKSFIKKLGQTLDVQEMFFANEKDLFSITFNWFKFYNELDERQKVIIDQLKEKKDWRKVFLIYYLNTMLVNEASTDLPKDDEDLKELDKSLSELEKEQINYIKQYWFSKQIDATRDFDRVNPNLAVENLYNKRAGKRHKRLSLRQIVKSDFDLFTTFFPVILTTPDVCSNLFKGKNQYFDIVMFDEASQLKLEDNLPALLKGKQIIIAGDEHQMPPSNYFSKTFDRDIEDEDFEDEDEIKVDRDNMLLSCESLLDFASELNFEKKHLDFHYRSRHPYLIDFSNHAFYNQRLKPLPNEFDYKPISYIPVNGTYSENSNDAEAETILSILDKNISRYPNGSYPSVGIATFNINQRNLILSKINERKKFEHFYEFNQKMTELEDNGFFVKNLENIQGDERDVIILSTTYGINKEGKFAHRFGSINQQKGYKLLNVIITRAKYKVYVCSSIPEEHFLGYKEFLTAEGSNNRRAVFFTYLAYAKAVSDQDEEARLSILNALAENANKGSRSTYSLNEDLESPFEEEVYNVLLDNFEESKIIPQLQFAGFRIDMVYDTGNPGLPKIAIECDGAAYHSSQEAYLHDRHRQKTLENHGFVFHRIWSTNWWRNTKKETELLVQFIKSVERSSPSLFEDKSDTKYAFTDNIEVIENEISMHSPEVQVDLSEAIKAVSKPTEIQTELFQEVIEVNSKVKVKYLNNGKDIKVHLVDQEITKTEKSNGVQKVNIKSALGLSLIGKTIGERIRVGQMDNYVEILKIINKK